MMTEIEFSAWSAGSNLTRKGIEFTRQILRSKWIRRRRDQEAARHRKTVVFQSNRAVHLTDSAHRAFWSFVTTLCLERRQFLTEPPPVKVSYVNGQGHRVNFLYTADLIVLRESSMHFVDVSTEAFLLGKAQRSSGFLKQELGVWRCPPMEQALSQYGIGFIIWTPQSASLQSRR